MPCFCRKWIVIFAACLSASVSSFPSYWSNLSSYTVSFLQSQSHSTSGTMAPWVLPLWIFGCCNGAFLSGTLSRIIGKRGTFFGGILFQNVGICSVYFCIKANTWILSICLGLLNGVGSGCVQYTTLHIILDWVGKRSGLFIGIHRSCMVLGAVVTSQLMTLILNPSNKQPDIRIGHVKFFSQPDIINLVPLAYLVMGGLFFVIQTLCLLFVSENTFMDEENNSKRFHEEEVQAVKSKSLPPGKGQIVAKDINKNSHYGTLYSKPLPVHILKTPEFYVLFSTMALATISYIVVNDYFKFYGQIWFQDDHFLANVLEMYLVAMILSLPGWGLFLDYFGIKTCLMLYFTILPLINILLYFSPMFPAKRWSVCLVMIAYGMSGAQFMSLYATSVSKTFGRQNFATHFGLVSMSWGLASLAVPKLATFLLKQFGWFYVFGMAAFANVIALIVTAVAFSGKTHG